MSLRYGTQSLIGGTQQNAQQYPSSVAPLAQSMQKAGTPTSSPYTVGQPMTNLVTPSTLGTNPVPQPMIYPFGPTPTSIQGTQLPPSDTTTQTGNGGGQSTIPGVSEGLPGQANTGRAPVPTTPGVPNPGMPGVYTNQATQIDPNRTGQGGARQFIANYNASHQLQNLTPEMFNAANQHNSETAFQMLQQGGQQFRNAVMAKNGWTQDQMNNWINQVGAENSKTFTPEAGSNAAFAQFGATPGQMGQYGSQGYAPGFTGPAPGAGTTPTPTTTPPPSNSSSTPPPVNQPTPVPTNGAPNKGAPTYDTTGDLTQTKDAPSITTPPPGSPTPDYSALPSQQGYPAQQGTGLPPAPVKGAGPGGPKGMAPNAQWGTGWGGIGNNGAKGLGAVQPQYQQMDPSYYSNY